MRNKLFLLIFILTLCGTVSAQEGSDNNQKAQISIYPNPVVEFIVVQVKGDFSNAEFELNSMIGNKLQINPVEIGIGKYKIRVEDIKSGYYFLIVKIKNKGKPLKKAVRFLKN